MSERSNDIEIFVRLCVIQSLLEVGFGQDLANEIAEETNRKVGDHVCAQRVTCQLLLIDLVEISSRYQVKHSAEFSSGLVIADWGTGEEGDSSECGVSRCLMCAE